MLKFKSLKDKYSLLDFTHRKKDYIFLDLEFNCFTDDDSFHEITSIGAIKCDKNFNSINCFHSFVRPISFEKNENNSDYSNFYKLNINKKAPKDGLSFRKVIDNFNLWLGDTDCEIFVWGTQDTPVLLSNLEAFNLQDKYSFLLNRIKNIQPEVSGNVKVLGNPINYSISLGNMKKLYFLEKEVAHNGLLDSIDLMTVFKKYKTNATINQNILCELSYAYRNVDTSFQFNNFKKSNKVKKSNGDIKSRALIKSPSFSILEKVKNTLESCDFKFTNEHPKFNIDQAKNQIIIDKVNKESEYVYFNTNEFPCVATINDTHTKLSLKNNSNNEELLIDTTLLHPEVKNKLENEIVFSSYIGKNLEILEHKESDISFIKYLLDNIGMNYSNNIEDISITNDELHVKRRKDDKSSLVCKYNCSFYIKSEGNSYTLSLLYKSLHNKIVSQTHFTVPKTDDTESIIKDIIANSYIYKSGQPKLTNISAISKRLIINLAKNKALRTKRKSQLFINNNNLSFLNGRYMDYINLDNSSFFITNKERPALIFKNLQNSKSFEIRILKNKKTIGTINELFRIYSKERPDIVKITDINPYVADKLNTLRRLPEFNKANKFTYSINNSYIKVRRNINKESSMEIYKLNDFNTTINISTNNNVSLHFINKKDKKKMLVTCISSKKLSKKDINTIIEYNKNNYNNEFVLINLSNDLFKIVSKYHSKHNIGYSSKYSNLELEDGLFKFKKNIKNDYNMNSKDLSIEVVISNNLMFIKLFDDNQIYHYSIDNNEYNQQIVNELFKTIKKQKSNSWIKVLEINKNIRNSIWRVLENSNMKSDSSLLLDSNFMHAEQKKYFYKNTALSVKKLDSDKMLLQFGGINSITYDITINDKNEAFVEDLIDNSLFYEAT